MYAIWLLFDKIDTKYFENIIKKFSEEFNAPIFVPHITVYGILNLDIELIKKRVKNSIQGIEPFFIEKLTIRESDDIWKTLFVDIKINQELSIINNKLKLEFTKLSEFKFVPHISLLYKKINKENRILNIKKLKIKNEFLINKIAVLKFSNNVNKWKVIETIKL